jgi:hypothetical protein
MALSINHHRVMEEKEEGEEEDMGIIKVIKASSPLLPR